MVLSRLRSASCRRMRDDRELGRRRRSAPHPGKIMSLSKAALFAAALCILPLSAPLGVHAAPTKDAGLAAAGDIPAKFEAPRTGYDYVKRVEMIPMRDGVKLYTVIWIPKEAHNAPI